MMTNLSPRHGRLTGGFTLVEMLTVIGILAILLAIIIPAINGARNAARRADTVLQVNQLGDACQRFIVDKKRNPGYFNASVMADAQNASTYGFTNMQNVLLDLVGGITKQAANPASGLITVGPSATPANQVVVDLGAIGSTTQTDKGGISAGYLTLDSKRYLAQSVAAKKKAVAGNDNEQLPELVDTFGQPILAWVKNDIDTGPDFAAENATTSGAKFYWAPNATLVNAESVGRLNADQRFNNDGSLLNETVNVADRIRTLTAMLGNPNAADTSVNPPKPTAAKGSIVFHSAGINGVYLGKKERGGTKGVVVYTPGQDPFSGGAFDDIFAASGQ